jgi:DNA-binding NtrC family response regulator
MLERVGCGEQLSGLWQDQHRAIYILAMVTGPEHILVVEDTADVRLLLEDMLTESGYTVAAVASVDQARELLASRRPSAAIIDLFLPRESGLALVEELTSDHIPTVLISGDPGRAEAVAPSDAHVMAKPFGMSDLRIALRGAIELQQRKLAKRLPDRA